jgi:hypothetical protein
MLPTMLNRTRTRSFVKRQLIKINFGGHENNPSIGGSNNKVVLPGEQEHEEQSTLLRKAGHQVGKIIVGGTDIATAPAKWLNHMMDNWYASLIVFFSNRSFMEIEPLRLYFACMKHAIKIYVELNSLLIDRFCTMIIDSFHK